jgi:hypothetical protein
MTCIVGLAVDGDVYMGGDSATVSGWDMRLVKDPKVFRIGDFIMGITGHSKFRHILKYYFVIPEHTSGITSEIYMALHFTDALREATKVAGYAKKENEQESVDSDVLIGYRGELFELQGSHFQLVQVSTNYQSVGCGSSIALGSLYSTERLPIMTPKERVLCALQASAEFNMGVRGPFHIEVLGDRSRQ